MKQVQVLHDIMLVVDHLAQDQVLLKQQVVLVVVEMVEVATKQELTEQQILVVVEVMVDQVEQVVVLQVELVAQV